MVTPPIRFILSLLSGSLLLSRAVRHTRRAHLACGLASILLCSAVAADRGGKLMEFFAVLDACYTRKDLPGLIRLAARTEGGDFWHMPNGLGPTDAASLRIKALELRAKAIFNETGLLGNEIVSALEASLSAREADLLTQLRVDPADTAQMLQLLNDEDPSVRWIGIYKTRFVAEPAAPILQKLRAVAAGDRFVVLDERPFPGVTPIPEGVHRGETRLEFVAPLRTLVNKRLAKWNQAVPEDPGDIARTGLQRLLDDFLADSKRELEILSAVERFHPQFSPVAKAEVDAFVPRNADERRAIERFRGAIRARWSRQ